MQSLDTLYREHHAWLVKLLLRKLDSREGAADIAHDTFEHLLRQGSALQALREPRAYLTAVAQRLAISQHRRQILEHAYLQALQAQPEALAPPPETRLMIMQALETICRVLEGLSPRTRTIFLLSRLDGLSHLEIAAALHISPKAVQKAISQVLQHCYAVIYAHDV
ncbi:sigma-70 family RNA polymerase sigma factor [Verticiella sediminum]|uniref:Sigma-70 family RNA polymerase sigma factor n=2 Tax=Verticiella sediminum TaxID=1247510 RepID=A0A556AM05_9BURK|nr:sigma-70 family RNA polymerase sigma factor [Verticiella sediminum]